MRKDIKEGAAYCPSGVTIYSKAIALAQAAGVSELYILPFDEPLATWHEVDTSRATDY